LELVGNDNSLAMGRAVICTCSSSRILERISSTKRMDTSRLMSVLSINRRALCESLAGLQHAHIKLAKGQT
jgi:hypothetical protein